MNAWPKPDWNLDPKHDISVPWNLDPGHDAVPPEELKRIKDSFPRHEPLATTDWQDHCGLQTGDLDLPDVTELRIHIKDKVRILWLCGDLRHDHRYRLTAWLCGLLKGVK